MGYFVLSVSKSIVFRRFLLLFVFYFYHFHFFCYYQDTLTQSLKSLIQIFILQTLQVNNSKISTTRNAKFPQGIIFIRTDIWGIFPNLHQCTCMYEVPIKFLQQNINLSKTGIDIKNLSLELLLIFFRKPITQNTQYPLCESPMYLR